jgi:hypothetical protein
VTALIAVYTGDGCAGRCDAKCYNAWGPECHCICQGANHGERMWSLVNLEVWQRIFLDGEDPGDVRLLP